MRSNHLLNLIGSFRKAHGTPPASGFVTATKMPVSRALSKFSQINFTLYIPLSGRGEDSAVIDGRVSGRGKWGPCGGLVPAAH